MNFLSLEDYVQDVKLNMIYRITKFRTFEHVVKFLPHENLTLISNMSKISRTVYFISFTECISSEVHQYTTRSNQELKYYIPRFRLVRFQKSFTYTGIKIWNNTEKKLKQLFYSKFRNTYKAILSEAYNT